MDTDALTKPKPTVQKQLASIEEDPPKPRPRSEFDPCANAKITSPFYLYAHDSPRPSYDSKPRTPIHISVTDLESGALTPSITQEKGQPQNPDNGNIHLWNRRPSRCMTKPQKSWFKSLPHRQRLLIKILIGLVLAGLIIGVAVGISIRVHGGVWKSSNQTAKIGD